MEEETTQNLQYNNLLVDIYYSLMNVGGRFNINFKTEYIMK